MRFVSKLGREHRQLLVVGAAIALSAFLLYVRTYGYSFVRLDDFEYVPENPNVISGLTFNGIAWAATSSYMGNWHPLTWISHMVDASLFGPVPGPAHLVNAGLHALVSASLFFALQKLTGSVGRSAAVALLFAVHPLHVESVAWIAERKDLLCGLFFVLALYAYARYAARRQLGWYLGVLLLFSLALLSKPMAVTFPFVLLLLDVWPLGRWQEPDSVDAGPRSWRRLTVEKLPMFALAAGSAAITVYAQRASGAVASLAQLPLSSRLLHVPVAYVSYLAKAFWPSSLAVIYPYPRAELPVLKWATAVALLALVVVVAVVVLRRQRAVVVGLLWFVGMLVPVIGIVQVGPRAMADRYTYLPLAGLLVAVVWPLADLGRRLRLPSSALWGAVAAPVVACVVLTHVQVGYWRDGVLLFRRAIELTGGNATLRNALADELADRGEIDAAIGAYRAALRDNPQHVEVNNNLANLLAARGNTESAEALYRQAIAVQPTYGIAHLNLGILLDAQGRLAEAMVQLRRATELRPDDAKAHDRLGVVLAKSGDLAGALAHLREALRIYPASADVHNNLGIVYVQMGQRQNGISEFRAALVLDPSYAPARQNLERLRLLDPIPPPSATTR